MTKRLTCSMCKKGFQNGDRIQATVISIYREIEKPGMNEFQYAIARPSAATNIQHLVCGDTEE